MSKPRYHRKSYYNITEFSVSKADLHRETLRQKMNFKQWKLKYAKSNILNYTEFKLETIDLYDIYIHNTLKLVSQLLLWENFLIKQMTRTYELS